MWSADMSVGNALLDHDHKALMELVNELHTATSRGEGRQVVDEVLRRLVAYTQQHFRREEHHMECVHYPKLAEHREQHRALMGKVLELVALYQAGHVCVAAQVSALLRDWLSIHVRRDDKEFASAA